MSLLSGKFMLLCCVTRNVYKGLLMVRPSLHGDVQVILVQNLTRHDTDSNNNNYNLQAFQLIAHDTDET